ncbi:ATP-binding protein [Salinigranum salinum]|uniref:ATP-binding protein n=1 Tax=Salinigranum salinum TaxID=1364937 RepID=UPI0012609CFB|nr:ATP-binding protein [Salinigranum salinum]
MTPYADSRDHLRDELARLDLLLRLRLEEWWEENDRLDEFRGLYVSDEAVDRLLQTASPGASGDEAGRERRRDGHQSGEQQELLARIEEATRRLRERRARTPAERGLRLDHLAARFALDRRDQDALLVAVAPELDRKYETIYSYLQDDVTRTRPTVELIRQIVTPTAADRLDARATFAPRSPLRRSGLVRVRDEDRPLLSRTVSVDERVVAFLLGDDDVDPELADVAELTTADRSLTDLVIDTERREALKRIAARREEGGPFVIHLHGPRGVGKAAAVAALCAIDGTPILTVDARAIEPSRSRDTFVRLRREAHLQAAALYLRQFPSARPAATAEDESERVDPEPVDPDRLLGEVDAFDGPVFLSGERPLPSRLLVGVVRHDVATLHLPRPDYEHRRALWEAVDDLPDSVDTAALAATFRLTAGGIRDAMAAARIDANGDDLTGEHVYRGCRAQTAGNLSSLAKRVEPTYTWDDIVLPADRLAHLREVAAHLRHRGRVYDEWAFARKFSLGNGLNVLFTGASGTGKTMAAEVVANDAGLELYKIDLSTVVSKYIGETEKNLSRVFDEAETSDAILFFDEADALFGKRTEVKDSHDRYANIEVNYLLQRIEEHDGTVVLTTNFAGNIDDAFRRRIHHSVDFPVPDRASREAIWRGIFPAETPVGTLDYDFLAGLDLVGGNIKNVALTAAFLAADDDSAVEMEHVVRATKREFQKLGRLLKPEEFGEYREFVA